MALYIRLREEREKARLTQQALAVRCEMSVSSIQKIEAQKIQSLPWQTIEKISNALNCEVWDLIEWNGEKYDRAKIKEAIALLEKAIANEPAHSDIKELLKQAIALLK